MVIISYQMARMLVFFIFIIKNNRYIYTYTNKYHLGAVTRNVSWLAISHYVMIDGLGPVLASL